MQQTVIIVFERIVDAAHKETSALLRSTQNIVRIVRRKHHVPVHGVPSTGGGGGGERGGGGPCSSPLLPPPCSLLPPLMLPAPTFYVKFAPPPPC